MPAVYSNKLIRSGRNTVSNRLTVLGVVADPIIFRLSASRNNIADLSPVFSRASSGTFTDNAEVIQTAAINVLRRSWRRDASQVLVPTYLLGQQRTNLFLQSRIFTSLAWVKSNLTITGNVHVAPDGNTTGASATNATLVSSTLTQGLSLSVSTRYTRSIYAKAISGTGVLALEYATGLETGNAQFNLLDGTIISQTTTIGSLLARIENVGNGWYRCSISYTTASSGAPTSGAIFIGAYGASSTATTIAIWQAQKEAGPSPSFPIYTVAEAVTRAADSLSFPQASYPEWTRYQRYYDLAAAAWVESVNVGADSYPPAPSLDRAYRDYAIARGVRDVVFFRERI